MARLYIVIADEVSDIIEAQSNPRKFIEDAICNAVKNAVNISDRINVEIDSICSRHNIDRGKLTGNKAYSTKNRIFIYKILRRQGYSLNQIARPFNRSHSSVLQALKKDDIT